MTHESYSEGLAVKRSSDRVFGLVMSAAFGVIACAPMLSHRPSRTWALGVSLIFLVVALVWPAALKPLNRLWTALGMLIGKVVHPVVMGLMFGLVFTPAGVVLRAIGKDLLRLGYDKSAESYWDLRPTPATPFPQSLHDQF